MTPSNAWMDFNDAPERNNEPAIDTEDLRTGLQLRLELALQYLYPQGRILGNKFHVGDTDGTPGKSLVVELNGPKRGLWKDFSTDDGGDIIDLWASSRGLSAKYDFPQLTQEIGLWLGITPVAAPLSRPATSQAPIDTLGPPSARWDYQSPAGDLIACVYRYDPPTGKEYRPWDVRSRMWRAPDPRPLYNQPAIASSRKIVLVEGEKCADALISCGIVATSAMNGARAPINKTDWAPLKGKDVVIWPDRDAPGWDYAEEAARACVTVGCRSVAILVPPESKPQKWDAADAVSEGFDCRSYIENNEHITIKSAPPVLPAYTMGEILDDPTPTPPDIISNRIMTQGGIAVFGGAPKVGKSDFLMSLLTHMASGMTFLGMVPAKPLTIFYLQSEIQYPYLKERLKGIHLPKNAMALARCNLVVTPQLNLILDDKGLEQLILTISTHFGGEPPDIIAIDPIRNVFDGGPSSGGENDNDAMMFFLTRRVSVLHQRVNPNAGVILVHHTKKITKKQFEEDPFQAFSGASSLRGFYSSSFMLFRPNEALTVRQLIFELRNGPGLPSRYVDKIDGQWQIIDSSQRLIHKDYGQKLDAERLRKLDVIVQILIEEALKGNCYTTNQFAEAFEGKAGLGSSRSIRDRISALATQGYIKYFRNSSAYGLPPCRTKFGYLCVEYMVMRSPSGQPDPATGEVQIVEISVLPTHFKCPQSGAAMPVENPNVWVYQNDLNSTQEFA